MFAHERERERERRALIAKTREMVAKPGGLLALDEITLDAARPLPQPL